MSRKPCGVVSRPTRKYRRKEGWVKNKETAIIKLSKENLMPLIKAIAQMDLEEVTFENICAQRLLLPGRDGRLIFPDPLEFRKGRLEMDIKRGDEAYRY